jgi:hypothetical protein
MEFRGNDYPQISNASSSQKSSKLMQLCREYLKKRMFTVEFNSNTAFSLKPFKQFFSSAVFILGRAWLDQYIHSGTKRYNIPGLPLDQA